MTTERLHFMVESPANFVRLACTILFEKREAMSEWAATWHDVFDCANGEQLFLQFMEELFPDGCTIGEKELKQITDRAVRYLQTENSRQTPPFSTPVPSLHHGQESAP